MKYLSLLLCITFGGSAFGQSNPPDLDLMQKAGDGLNQLRAKFTVPGFEADGNRTTPGRFTLNVVSPDQIYLLDTASGRLWLLKEETLVPVVESPDTWLEGVFDQAREAAQ